MTTQQSTPVPYTPDQWTADQRAMHTHTDLDAALHAACCLAGGWYHRPVTIDMQIVGDVEHYTLRPSEIACPEGWTPVYTIIREPYSPAATLGRAGGSVSSPRKTDASRRNGAKGGRPPNRAVGSQRVTTLRG